MLVRVGVLVVEDVVVVVDDIWKYDDGVGGDSGGGDE